MSNQVDHAGVSPSPPDFPPGKDEKAILHALHRVFCDVPHDVPLSDLSAFSFDSMRLTFVSNTTDDIPHVAPLLEHAEFDTLLWERLASLSGLNYDRVMPPLELVEAPEIAPGMT